MEQDYALQGIHHITLIAGNADRTARFYVETLGLGFVKKTVNFDRPNTYHLYFGDRIGTPGTLVTFFEWPDAARGVIGVGTTHHFAMTVETAEAQLKWKRRLVDAGLHVSGPYDRKAFRSIYFTDPDGVILEIATRGPGFAVTQNGEDIFIPPLEVQRPYRSEAEIAATTWPEPITSISPDMELHGLHHISAMAADIERTDAFYQEILDLPLVRKSVNYDDPSMPHWYWGLEGGRPGSIITYFGMNNLPAGARPVGGRVGRGMTHHFAFEVFSDDALPFWQDRLREQGVGVTPVMDRKYFHSIYFNDPDGHILEIATRQPGFLVDQPVERLGRDLALPNWLEAEREEIEAQLQPITLEQEVTVG
ncbi:MAG TPA: VOC family protein [Chloroflexota bacterium]